MLDGHDTQTLSRLSEEEIRLVQQAKGAGESKVPAQAPAVFRPILYRIG
jgi:hypothetical protein